MTALNTLLILLTAVCIPGLINRTRAVLAGRRGIRFAQHLYDVRLLLRKGAVYSPTTTAVFRAAPSVTLGTALVAALFVPVGDLPSALSFEGDLIAFAYLLALGRVALILAAMDTGSSFEGMGASREALYGALVEPALMLVFGTLALLSGYTSFDAIFSGDAVNGMQLVVVLLLAAYALPGEPVRDHVYDSAVKIAGEGLYPEYLNFKLFQMDNYTDTIMLTEAASADEAPPLTAMMTNTAYNVDNFETLADDLQWYIVRDWAAGAQRTDAPALVPFSYARYWHGYLIWLRPLLLITDITGVRVVQYLVLAALFAAVAVLLRRRCGLRAAVWFAVSQLLVTAFWAPHQVQFFTCFAVAYAGCVWVLAKPRRSDDVCLALLVLGVVTSFCDLLVTPVLTLGLPLVCWLLEPQQRLRAGTRQCGIVVGGSLTWGVGYLLCWASKWVLAGLVTGQNVIADALHQVGVRTAADSWHGMELTWGNILHFVYTTLAGKHLFWPLVLVVVLLLALFAASIRDRQQLARALPLGLCALMTPVWFIVLRTHSIQHGWFTWRALGLTVFAGLAFLYYCCDVRQIAKRLKRT